MQSLGMALMLVALAAGENADAPPGLRIVDCHGVEAAVPEAKFLPNWKLAGTRLGQPFEMSVTDLLAIRWANGTEPRRRRHTGVVLATGEVIRGVVQQCVDEKAIIRSESLGMVTVPLTAVRGLLLDGDATSAKSAALLQQIAATDQAGDRLISKNGDVVVGTLKSIDDTHVQFERSGKGLAIERGVAAAVALDPALTDYRAGSNFLGRLTCRDGSIVHLHGLETAKDRYLLRLAWGDTVTVDPADLIELSGRNGRVVYLSDLVPVSVEMRPFLDATLPHRLDQSVVGGPLRLGEREFVKGIGVRSYSALKYTTEGFATFEAMVGLDPSAGSAGSVRFVVQLDGATAFESGEMVISSEPKKVRVPLDNVKQLSLIVDFANRGDVLDHANWCEARLVRADGANRAVSEK